MAQIHLFRAHAMALILTFALSACASSKPQPGSLEFLKLRSQQDLASSCYEALTRNPWKKTYYSVGGALVDERVYCNLKAQHAVKAMAFR